ncbi:cytochrome-c peroxidase [Flavobacteriales bacterium]|nr:cytochrome-c peroxidase [Flavobacteriales bacterium]
MTAFVVSTVVLLTSCNPSNAVNPDQVDKDFQMLATIIDALGQQGYSQLHMPDPHDLDAIPQDPNNPLTSQKVSLGRMLFHETALGMGVEESGTRTFSCASCHHASAGFQAGIQQGLGDGGVGFGIRGEERVISSDYDPSDIDRQPMRSPTAMNGAFTPVTLWNGQFGAHGPNVGTESLWTEGTPLEVNSLGYFGLETQAIAGLTVHRMAPTPAFFNRMPGYVALFDAAFPEVAEEDRYGVEMAGLAIAAYERTIMSNESPFQRWLDGEHTAMTPAQKDGAMVFFGAAQCGTCHNGPALSDGGFHALGMPDMPNNDVLDANVDDYGMSSEDAALGRGGFTGADGDKYAFKTPQLYNLMDSRFFGHGGTFYDLADVVDYKLAGASAKPEVTPYLSTEFDAIEITEEQQSQLMRFLVEALYDPALDRYVPANTLSGNCFPNNDSQSSIDLGCSEPL